MDLSVQYRRGLVALALLIGLGLFLGCKKDTRQMYSGDFSVISYYPQNVRVHDFKNFDSWRPLAGNLIPNAEAGSHFPWKEDFPESTIVVWSEEGSDDMQEQEIDLRGVVPRGVAGTTHFTLGADGVWTVEFIEGDPF